MIKASACAFLSLKKTFILSTTLHIYNLHAKHPRQMTILGETTVNVELKNYGKTRDQKNVDWNGPFSY